MGEASSKATAPRASSKVRIVSPRFLAFLAAQALGAANDNALKITLVLFLISAVSGETRQVRYSSLATALFPIPFLLFSPVAGYLADRFAKHRVLLWTKCPEILVMDAGGSRLCPAQHPVSLRGAVSLGRAQRLLLAR